MPPPTVSSLVVPPWMAHGSGSWSVLVEPPTVEPLTLEEAKLRAGLDWPAGDPRDALMTDFIAAARSQVERDTGLALLTQTRDVYFYTMPNGMMALPAQSIPLQEVIEVAAFESPTPTPLSGFVLAAPTVPGPTVDTLGGLTSGIARIKVGWLNPGDLRQRAPLLVQAVGLMTAHYATAGRDAVITGTTAVANPYGYEEAIQSYRLMWLP